MRAAIIRQPGGLDRIDHVDRPEPGLPAPGEIVVKVHASSLNFHDYHVVSDEKSVDDNRILLSDGAGVVVATGEDFTEFSVGGNI